MQINNMRMWPLIISIVLFHCLSNRAAVHGEDFDYKSVHLQVYNVVKIGSYGTYGCPVRGIGIQLLTQGMSFELYFHWKATSKSDPRITYEGSSSVLVTGASMNIIAKMALDKNGFLDMTDSFCDVTIGSVVVLSEDDFILREFIETRGAKDMLEGGLCMGVESFFRLKSLEFTAAYGNKIFGSPTYEDVVLNVEQFA